nr:tyrosine-type recombinase/integrase [uncultured Draconibacterium sp.]
MEVNGVLVKSFEKWLQTLGYAESTVFASVNYLRDFAAWLDKNNTNSLEQIDKQTLGNYHKYLQTRRNKRKPGSLSQNYIISNINALKRFSKYLQVTEKANLEIDIRPQSSQVQKQTILTRAEIGALYKACGNDILGIRDRAILGIYYGCGLRRSEGQALNLDDILLREKLVYVRKGKYYKERYVPMTETIREDFENYIYVSRAKILSFKNVRQEAFFLGMRVKRLGGNALINRIHKLTEAAKIDKETGLHTLRHSIASHLLQSGMTLEEVSQFLGHASLESTQIYTHLTNE